MARQRLGAAFGWLWSAYAASAVGTALGFGALPLIAITVLGAGPAAVAALSAIGLAVGAVLAVPLGPWVETRRKKPVMIDTDLVRCLALLTVPLAYAFDVLSYAQLLIVAALSAAANIAFASAGGAYLKQLVRPAELLTANSRFETTLWTATATGPTVGGAAITLFGPAVTLLANAAGFLLSALGVGAIRERELTPVAARAGRRAADLVEGWRFIRADLRLRALLWNTVAVNALIMATEPLLAVLLLDELGWAAWQYGLAFGLPCVGGVLGAQLARRLQARYGRRRILRAAGILRAVPPLGLVAVMPGTGGVVLVIIVQSVLLTGMGVFVPLFATERLRRVPDDRISRVLVSWNVTSKAAIAALTALWGVLGTLTAPRIAIGLAGLLLLATPLLLRERGPAASDPRPPARVPAS